MAKIKQTKKTLFQFMNTIITQLLKNGQHRTMQHYKTTLNTYTDFRRNRIPSVKLIQKKFGLLRHI